ncbi:hypothetical protein [Pseudoduganella sp. OTU4001]|uniref:hypothetical protein n=1 Tax=Pseudoduganella sp. OTU4001 TaxID=3043854 RepID=UPI00313B5D77
MTLLAVPPKGHRTTRHRLRGRGRRNHSTRVKAHRLLHPPLKQRMHKLEMRPHRRNVIPARLQHQGARQQPRQQNKAQGRTSDGKKATHNWEKVDDVCDEL